jgi:hypothetical protein
MLANSTITLPSARVSIPETWATLDEFAQWYLDASTPFMISPDSKINRIDNGSTFSLFRHGPFQVELYILDDMTTITDHEHPCVDILQLDLFVSGSTDISETVARFQPMLESGMAHGENAKFSGGKGGTVMLAFERWPEGVTPGAICSVWKGKTLGPLHEGVIRSYFPAAYIKDGYADITRLAD